MTPEELQEATEKLVVLYNSSKLNEAKSLAYELLEQQLLFEDTETIGKINNILGVIYQNISDYPNALLFYFKSLQIFETTENKKGIAANLGNIGIIYSYLSDYQKALLYYEKSLHFYKEIGIKSGISSNLGNIGILFQKLSDYAQALEYFEQALSINEEIRNEDGIAANLGNVGLVYFNLSDYSNALEYYEKALKIYEKNGIKVGIANNLVNIGNVYARKEDSFYDSEKAEKFYHKSLKLAEEIGSKEIIKEVFEQLHSLKLNEELYKEALEYQTKAIYLEKEILSIEAKKQADSFDFERKNAAKEKQLAEERGRLLERESILRNILPDSVTDRLVKGENPIADHFETASVLFMDLVGFTSLASITPPKQLVHVLDSIFSKADSIVEMFGLEKIKTIGDGYLAVANVTSPLEEHQMATALAALQLLETMKNFTVNIPTDLGETNWIKDINDIEIRIGIHTGEVVAGIIGKNKYTYDLWGDAVNVASRMESYSEPGRIQISEQFAKSIEHNSEFVLIPRGEITIKGKGTMNTFWLEKAV